MPLVIGCMDFEFIGGSLGSVMGERISRAADYCIEHRYSPAHHLQKRRSKDDGKRFLADAAGQNYRASLSQLTDAKHPLYFACCTDPSFGGISASFGMLGDLNIAEPGALIGFAGPACDQRDHQARSAGRFSAQRIPARTRLSRFHCRQKTDKRKNRHRCCCLLKN